MIIESISLVQTHPNRYNIFIAKDLLPLLFNNKMRFSHVCLSFVGMELGHSANVGHVIRNFDFNWINSLSLFKDFENANIFFLALISLKISQ